MKKHYLVTHHLVMVAGIVLMDIFRYLLHKKAHSFTPPAKKSNLRAAIRYTSQHPATMSRESATKKCHFCKYYPFCGLLVLLLLPWYADQRPKCPKFHRARATTVHVTNYD